MSNPKQAVVKSAARALDIIEFIVNTPRPLTFTAIQDALAIPKSSLSYLLQDLTSRDYIEFDSSMRVYYPGLKLIQISATCMNNANISREIWQGISKLSDELGETTHAAILEGRFAVYIAKCQGVKNLSAVTTIGFRIPAHATGLGKMLLAALSEDELAARLKHVEFERFTEHTIVSYDELRAELRQIAAQGYAVDNQEIIPGGICVAWPVYDKSHQAVAAISATVPAIRINREVLAELIDKVGIAADNVSLRLGKI